MKHDAKRPNIKRTKNGQTWRDEKREKWNEDEEYLRIVCNMDVRQVVIMIFFFDSS